MLKAENVLEILERLQGYDAGAVGGGLALYVIPETLRGPKWTIWLALLVNKYREKHWPLRMQAERITDRINEVLNPRTMANQLPE